MTYKPERGRRSGETIASWLLATKRVIGQETARAYEKQVAAGTCTEAFLTALGSGLVPGQAEVDPKKAPARRATAKQAAASRPVRAAGAAGDPAYDVLASWFGQNQANELYAEMSAQGAVPQLFPGGPDGGRLPLACASGLDPAAMRNAAIWARRGIANEPALAEAAELNEMAQTADDAQMLSLEPKITKAWQEFEQAVSAAALSAGKAVDARARDAHYDQREQDRRKAAAAVADLSEEEQSDRLFEGGIENRRAAESAERRQSRSIWFG